MIRRRLYIPRKSSGDATVNISAEQGHLYLQEGRNTLRIPLSMVDALISRVQIVKAIHSDLN